MPRYTYICENEECNYNHGFSMNFQPKEDPDRICDVCGVELKVVDKSTIQGNTRSSASIVSGVGDINSRLSGDFRDMMQSIKRGSPGSNMPDYK